MSWHDRGDDDWSHGSSPSLRTLSKPGNGSRVWMEWLSGWEWRAPFIIRVILICDVCTRGGMGRKMYTMTLSYCVSVTVTRESNISQKSYVNCPPVARDKLRKSCNPLFQFAVARQALICIHHLFRLGHPSARFGALRFCCYAYFSQWGCVKSTLAARLIQPQVETSTYFTPRARVLP